MLWYAIVSLRIAVLFYRSRNVVDLPPSLDLKPSARGFLLTIDGSWLGGNPLTASAIRQEVSQWKSIGYVLELRQV
jgi:exopolyphosphatase/guanosine-5'-triphosphate,3'-diphosphate pyrophosphatase